MQGEIVLPAEPASARSARRFVSDELGRRGLGDAASTASLLVSELVTNVVLHAGTELTLRVSQDRDVVRVSVADGSPRSARRRLHSVEAGTGRGLLLVEELASSWGVRETSAGKIVWFELSVGRGSEPAVG